MNNTLDSLHALGGHSCSCFRDISTFQLDGILRFGVSYNFAQLNHISISQSNHATFGPHETLESFRWSSASRFPLGTFQVEEIISLNEHLLSKGDRPLSHFGDFRMSVHLELFHIFAIVCNGNLQRLQNREGTRNGIIHGLSNTILQVCVVNVRVSFRNPDTFTEKAKGTGGDPSAPHARQGRHARIVPPRYNFVSHQLDELSFAQNCRLDIQSTEFNLLGLGVNDFGW